MRKDHSKRIETAYVNDFLVVHRTAHRSVLLNLPPPILPSFLMLWEHAMIF